MKKDGVENFWKIEIHFSIFPILKLVDQVTAIAHRNQNKIRKRRDNSKRFQLVKNFIDL